MRTFFAALLLTASVAGLGCSHETLAQSGNSAIVGGQAETRWLAAGYLTYAASPDALNPSVIACGATLIAPNVVMTAAHCVLAQSGATWAFGTGAPGSSPFVTVNRVQVHPKYNASNPLRDYDLAYLVLSSAVSGVTPAVVPAASPSDGCGDYEAVGYDGSGNRVGVDACIEIQPTLGSDPILEIHPSGSTALCVSNGDYGSALLEDDQAAPILVGLFVGSVTQPLTDCVTGTQYLDGYESAYGYADFFAQAIADGDGAGDAGSPADASTGASFDAAVNGEPDVGSDAEPDAGVDAGPDAGP